MKRDDQQQKMYESFSVFTRQKRSGQHYRDKSFMVTGQRFDRAFTNAIVNSKYMTRPVPEDETELKTRLCPMHLISRRTQATNGNNNKHMDRSSINKKPKKSTQANNPRKW
jgi:hypothetical protein